MEICKNILFGLSIYLSICFIMATIVALDNVDEGLRRINCGKFYAAEFIVPVTPIACLLSSEVSL